MNGRVGTTEPSLSRRCYDALQLTPENGSSTPYSQTRKRLTREQALSLEKKVIARLIRKGYLLTNWQYNPFRHQDANRAVRATVIPNSPWRANGYHGRIAGATAPKRLPGIALSAPVGRYGGAQPLVGQFVLQSPRSPAIPCLATGWNGEGGIRTHGTVTRTTVFEFYDPHAAACNLVPKYGLLFANFSFMIPPRYVPCHAVMRGSFAIPFANSLSAYVR
jgi:hypothetical protein